MIDSSMTNTLIPFAGNGFRLCDGLIPFCPSLGKGNVSSVC